MDTPSIAIGVLAYRNASIGVLAYRIRWFG